MIETGKLSLMMIVSKKLEKDENLYHPITYSLYSEMKRCSNLNSKSISSMIGMIPTYIANMIGLSLPSIPFVFLKKKESSSERVKNLSSIQPLSSV